MTIDGEIPTSYFLIISIGLTILSYLVYKKNGKSLEVYFLSVLTIIFYLSYFLFLLDRDSLLTLFTAVKNP